ncbi:MAG TPA: hypothetical protein VIJ88_00335 [Candidatus Paceibacterota bacterium]
MMTLIGLAIGFYVSLYLLPLIPGVIDFLSNNPNRYRPDPKKEGIKEEDIRARDYIPSTFGFFTYVHPGQVKIVERGGRFIRCIMAYDRHMFKGERSDNDLTPKHADYWEVIKTESPFHESHPIPFPEPKSVERKHRILWWIYSPLSISWWIWKRYVYRLKGAVFTGLPLFQGVRVYPMERFNRVTRGTSGNNKIELVRREDYSDQYRVAHFQYAALIPKADTRDMISVDVLLNEIAVVFNPYMVAYNTDNDWPTRFLGSVSNRITMFTRSRPLDEVWTAKSHEAATELADFITLGGKHFSKEELEEDPNLIEGSTSLIGIKILETQVLDISPSNPEDEQQLGAEARAIVTRKADQQLAKGKAAYVLEEGEALKAHPYADVVVQAEAMVRAAEAAGKAGGIVILGGQAFDPAQAAILQELRKQREQKGNP